MRETGGSVCPAVQVLEGGLQPRDLRDGVPVQAGRLACELGGQVRDVSDPERHGPALAVDRRHRTIALVLSIQKLEIVPEHLKF